jgi:hypothetical protein
MQAVLGQEVAFDRGRQQMKWLADLEVATKAVERTAEAIGEDIAKREQVEMQRAVQLVLPIIVGEPVPILHVQMDGTGVPVEEKPWAAKARSKGNPPTRGRSNWDACLRKRNGMRKASLSAISVQLPTRLDGKRTLARITEQRKYLTYSATRYVSPNGFRARTLDLRIIQVSSNVKSACGRFATTLPRLSVTVTGTRTRLASSQIVVFA